MSQSRLPFENTIRHLGRSGRQRAELDQLLTRETERGGRTSRNALFRNARECFIHTGIERDGQFNIESTTNKGEANGFAGRRRDFHAEFTLDALAGFEQDLRVSANDLIRPPLAGVMGRIGTVFDCISFQLAGAMCRASTFQATAGLVGSLVRLEFVSRIYHLQA